ncbi:MAG: hypothetical protein ACOCRO_03310 [Halanaerobiales bacterium]
MGRLLNVPPNIFYLLCKLSFDKVVSSIDIIPEAVTGPTGHVDYIVLVPMKTRNCSKTLGWRWGCFS